MTAFLLTLLRLSLLGSVVGVVLMGALHLLGRRISRAAGYYLWLLVLLRLCLPVWVDLPIPVSQQSAAVIGVTMINPAGDQTGGVAAVPPGAQGGRPAAPEGPTTPAPGPETEVPVPQKMDWGAVFTAPVLWFGVWALGFVLTLGRYVWSYLRFVRLVRQESRVPDQLALDVLKALDPGGNTVLAVCPAVPGPMALGLLRPTVVLPEGVEDRGRLEDILRHELTHLRRHDLLCKWLWAAVTSLHWFNPLMPVFRREVTRRCELACDEAAAGDLPPVERRRYGDTLLSLAAEPPKGLMVTTLCEEKEHLKERLVDLVNGRKRSPAALCLTLCLALLLGSCAMVGGTAPVTPGPEATPPPVETAPAATPDPDALIADAVLYDLGEGFTLALPADLAEDLLVQFPTPAEEGGGPLFPRVYHRPSYEASMEEFGAPTGFLFSLFRYDQVGYEQEYLAANGGTGQTVFAKDENWYYVMGEPTDVQYYARGDVIDDTAPEYQSWVYAMSRIPDIQADFTARNGLIPINDAADLDRPFQWSGEHHYVEVHSTDYSVSLTLLLSQPATQGQGGIWCVEGEFSNNYGGWSRVLPRNIDVTVREYYADLQAQADRGERPELLDPVQAARAWYQEEYSAKTLDGLTFALLEGEPAGMLWGRISRVTGQPGTLEHLSYLDGSPGSSEGRMAFPDREYLHSPYLYTYVWLTAQPPETIEGAAVRYRTEQGDQLLFLAEGDLLGVTYREETTWYRPAYPYDPGLYERMLALCAPLAE